MKIVALFFVGIISFFLATSAPLFAIDQKERGLYISPLRQEITGAPNSTVEKNFTVANYTSKPMVVTLSVQKFSVSDFAYDYSFSAPDNDWVKVSQNRVALEPNQNSKITYSISIPKNATPGGYYYTIIASSEVSGEGVPTTLQAATLLYLTVDGKLVRTSVFQNDSVPFLVTGQDIPYSFDVRDTGNVHFSAYFYGQTSGLLGLLQHPQSGTSHLLLPGATRRIDGSVPSPFLPGIYKFTYGYRVDFANFVTSKSTYILYIPPWSIVGLLFILMAGVWIIQKRRRKSREE